MSKENPITIGVFTLEQILTKFKDEKQNQPLTMKELWGEIGKYAVDLRNNDEEIVLGFTQLWVIIDSVLEIDKEANASLYIAALKGVKEAHKLIKEVALTWRVM